MRGPRPSTAFNPDRPPAAVTLAAKFLAGLLYLTVVAGLMGSVSGREFWPSLLVVATSATIGTAVCLVLLTRWSVTAVTGPRQFRLATLMIVTGLFSIHFGVVRWFATGRGGHEPRLPSDGPIWINTFVLGVGLTLISVPFLLSMAEALVWAAVWIVRRKAVRAWLLRRRQTPPE